MAYAFTTTVLFCLLDKSKEFKDSDDFNNVDELKCCKKLIEIERLIKGSEFSMKISEFIKMAASTDTQNKLELHD
jgi:hypothetical protein